MYISSLMFEKSLLAPDYSTFLFTIYSCSFLKLILQVLLMIIPHIHINKNMIDVLRRKGRKSKILMIWFSHNLLKVNPEGYHLLLS